MTLSRLSSPAADGPPVARLIEAARDVTGFLDGEVGGPLPGWHRAGGDNTAPLEGLYAALAEKYAAAGQPLWAVRMWTNLLWQPAYLMVVAAHFTGAVPSLSALSQSRKGADIVGFRYAETASFDGPLEARIARAGAELRAFADTVFAEVNGITRLKRIPALRLLTDRMLGAMVLLHRKYPELPAATIRDWCARWLAAMDLTGHGDLDSLIAPGGREVLIIARKGCCLDYLIEPGTYCATCPRQPDAVRLARQHADALQSS